MKHKFQSIFFWIYLLAVISLALIGGSIITSFARQLFTAYVIIILMFAYMDLQTIEECHRAQQKIFDDIDKKWPTQNFESIERKTLEDLRSDIQNKGNEYKHKCKRMSTRILNTLLVGIVFMWIMVLNIRLQFNTIYTLYLCSIIVQIVYCIAILIQINDHERHVTQILTNKLIYIDFCLYQNLSSSTYEFSIYTDSIISVGISILISLAASFIFALISNA